MTILYKVDYREKKLLEFFEKDNTISESDSDNGIDASYEKCNLDIADIHIIYSKKNKKKNTNDEVINYRILVERKSISDCVSSIKDNRYKEQKLRCKAEVAKDDKTLFCYILEGNIVSDCRNTKDQHMVYGFIISNQFRDDVIIINTSSVKETYVFINKLGDRLKKNGYKDFFKSCNEKKITKVTNGNICLDTTSTKDICSKINIANEKRNTLVNKLDASGNVDNTVVSLNETVISQEFPNGLLLLEYKEENENIKIVKYHTVRKSIDELFSNNLDNISPELLDNCSVENNNSNEADNIKKIIININSNKNNSNGRENNSNNEITNEEYLSSRIQKRKKGNITPLLCQQLMLTNIPGISSKTAIVILEHFNNSVNNLLTFINNSEMEKTEKIKELSTIQLKTETGKTRKLGVSIADKLCLFLGSSS
jgi:ERCC4-type nuclease